jgi:hypothetical protein
MRTSIVTVSIKMIFTQYYWSVYMKTEELGEACSTNEDIRNVYSGTRTLGESALEDLGGSGMIILK